MAQQDEIQTEDFAVEYAILPHDQFSVFSSRGGSDYGRVPTPAISQIVGKPDLLATIVIDEGFLPPGKEEVYGKLLLHHEMSEIEYIVSNPDFFEQALQAKKKGEMTDQSAHRAALVEEFRLASSDGVLDEYYEYWDEWIKERMGEVDDPEIRANLRMRIEQRAEAYEMVMRELLHEGDHFSPGLIK